MKRGRHYFIIWNGLGYSVVHGVPGKQGVYWNEMGSYAPWSSAYRVCWYAGVLGDSNKDFDTLDKLYQLVDAANAPMADSTLIGSALIDLDGNVYPAPYGDHTDAARNLVARHYPDTYRECGGDSKHCERHLENVGWIFVRHSISFHEQETPFTEPQLQTLRRWLMTPDAEQHSGDEGYLKGVKLMLRLHDVDLLAEREA